MRLNLSFGEFNAWSMTGKRMLHTYTHTNTHSLALFTSQVPTSYHDRASHLMSHFTFNSIQYSFDLFFPVPGERMNKLWQQLLLFNKERKKDLKCFVYTCFTFWHTHSIPKTYLVTKANLMTSIDSLGHKKCLFLFMMFSWVHSNHIMLGRKVV